MFQNILGALTLLEWYLLFGCLFYVFVSYPLIWLYRQRRPR